MARKKILVEDVAPLIERHRGNVKAMADELGVSRRTVDRRINESVKLQEALRQSRQTMIDNAESVLYNKVLAGNMTAVIFFLKTQGKNRGYTERREERVMNIDVTQLTDDQLRRIAEGEDPLVVIATSGQS